MSQLKGKKFLLVHPGGSLKVPIIQRILEHDIDLYVLDLEFPAYLEDFVKKESFIAADAYNLFDLLSKVSRFTIINSVRFDGIGTYFEHATPNTAMLAQMMDVIGMQPGIAYRGSNFKPVMRQRCAEAGIRSPDYILLGIPSKDKLVAALQQLGGKIVVKPIFGDDSNGVLILDEKSDIDTALTFLKNSCKPHHDRIFQYFTQEFMAESYLEGTQISVDGLIQNGKIHVAGITETLYGALPNNTAIANYIPPRLTANEYHQSVAYCKRLIQSLGFDNCGFHGEIRITSEGPVLIEISCRPPGGKIMEGYELAYGIDLVTAMLNLWMGIDVNLSTQKLNYIYQAGLFSQQSGLLEEINGLEIAAGSPGVIEMVNVTPPGQPIISYPDIPVPICYFSVQGENPQQLEERIQAVTKKINFSVTHKMGAL